MFSEYQEWDNKDANRRHEPIADDITEVSSLLNYEGGATDEDA